MSGWSKQGKQVRALSGTNRVYIYSSLLLRLCSPALKIIRNAFLPFFVAFSEITMCSFSNRQSTFLFFGKVRTDLIFSGNSRKSNTIFCLSSRSKDITSSALMLSFLLLVILKESLYSIFVIANARCSARPLLTPGSII